MSSADQEYEKWIPESFSNLKQEQNVVHHKIKEGEEIDKLALNLFSRVFQSIREFGDEFGTITNDKINIVKDFFKDYIVSIFVVYGVRGFI